MAHNVSAAKPGVGGGIWTAPAGSTLPVDASTALDGAFSSLGFVSEEGVTRAVNKNTKVVTAWGGTVVAVLYNSKTETLKFKIIEASNVDVLGLAFGEAAGDLTNGITVKSTNGQPEERAYVISVLLADNVHQRLVVPRGVVTEVGNIVYKDDDVIGYDLTITAIADSTGTTVYEYQKTVTP